MKPWQAVDAKQNFGRLVEAARSEPQLLMRRAEAVGVVMSMEHYRSLTAQANAEFADFLLSSPLEEHVLDKGLGVILSDDG